MNGVRFPGIALSCILPAYNEEAVIAQTVGVVHAYLARSVGDFEIVVVDDGSTDQTPQILQRLQESLPPLRVVRHALNRGYGQAVKTGYGAGAKPYLFLMDGDGQMDIEDLDRFLERVPEYDMVIGQRVRRADSLRRTVQAQLFQLAVRWLFRIPFRDPDCAFKLLKRTVWERVSPLECSGLMVWSELIWRAQSAGFRIVQLPVQHRPRRHGQPKAVRLRTIAEALRELAWLRFCNTRQ